MTSLNIDLRPGRYLYIKKLIKRARNIAVLALALIGLISDASLVMGPISPASVRADTQGWSYTGSLNTPRSSHTATLLSDGKVLVTGGQGGGDSAELYDPSTGAWSVTGNLNIPRFLHTATLLEDGKVLVAGGLPETALNTAELYDPATGLWSLTDNLNLGHYSHTATLLRDGKVLIAGGGDTVNYFATDAVEVYDPATGTWSLTGGLNDGRLGHTATLLANGKVLVAGGAPNVEYDGGLSSAELYDPATQTWGTTSSLNTWRVDYAAVLLPNGDVLVAGGDWLFPSPGASEIYHVATGMWSTNAGISHRYHHTLTLLENGKALLAGGYIIPGPEVLEEAFIYNPATGQWSYTDSLNTPRYSHTATLLPDGKVLVAGGSNGGNALNSAELYDPGTVNCAAQISPSGQFFSSMGGSGSVNLTTGNACNWAVSNSADWITLTSPASGSGPATVTFEVRENFTASPRSATLIIAGQSFTVVQAGGSGEGCDYSVSARFQTFSASGGTATINVSTTSQCAWQAVSNTSWITITSNGVGIGSTAVGFTVAANATGASRKGTITIAGQTFSVKQKGN
jgi:hypothetical protein